MTIHHTPTIFALATASGRAGVAVMRVSGAAARKAIAQLCRPNALPVPRMAVLRDMIDPQNDEVIDHALVLWFPAPHSFTGEDVVEFHLHGGRAVMNAVTECLRCLPNFRVAEPGEFTRRAFEHDKLDLTEAEAIADLVDADTAAQRRQALRQMDGALGTLYHAWAERLTRILAHSEADIDFADEDLPPDIIAKRANALQQLIDELTQHLDDKQRGERLREGFMVAILGAPNAGKSSLLNALARREAAIVSPIAGTTRDVIEVALDLGGYPVLLADTAGLRESEDFVESEGIRRAHKRADDADIKILLFDGSTWPQMDEATVALVDDTSVVVVNKIDLIEERKFLIGVPEIATKAGQPLFLSATTGENLNALTARIIHIIEQRFASTAQPSLTRARHRAALEECRDHLRRALTALETELVAEDIRLSVRALGRITGRVDVEDVLDLVFKEFCIGK